MYGLSYSTSLTSVAYCTHTCRHIPHTLPELVGECNIKRRNTSLSQMDFLRE